MKPLLHAVLDVPIRVAVWSIVVVLGAVAVEPLVLELPGMPVVGLLAVGLEVALAWAAVALTVHALEQGRAVSAIDAGLDAPAPGALEAGGEISVRVAGLGTAVLLAGVGDLPGDLAEALRHGALRVGAMLLLLGAIVWAAQAVRKRARVDP